MDFIDAHNFHRCARTRYHQCIFPYLTDRCSFLRKCEWLFRFFSLSFSLSPLTLVLSPASRCPFTSPTKTTLISQIACNALSKDTNDRSTASTSFRVVKQEKTTSSSSALYFHDDLVEHCTRAHRW